MDLRQSQFIAAKTAMSALIVSSCFCCAASSAQSEHPQDPPSVSIDSKLLARAQQGDVNSELSLAGAYSKGSGVPMDYSKSAFWLTRAASQGNPIAQFELGRMYHQGRGVPQDDAQAVGWYRKSADQGLAKAQVALASHFISGKGITSDGAQAADWYRRAAAQGDIEGEKELGGLYDGGIGVATDYSQAAYWYRKAAEQGDAWSAYLLGMMYEEGRGVPKDSTLAEDWEKKAADKGVIQAQMVLSGIAKRREDAVRLNNSLDSAGFLAILLAILVGVIYWNRKTFLANIEKIRPRSAKTKQLAVLLAIAIWYTCWFVYLANEYNPNRAAISALNYSMPAIAFGAIALWWLRQSEKDQ